MQRPKDTVMKWRSWKSKVTGVETRVRVGNRRQPHMLLEALRPGIPRHLGKGNAGNVPGMDRERTRDRLFGCSRGTAKRWEGDQGKSILQGRKGK